MIRLALEMERFGEHYVIDLILAGIELDPGTALEDLRSSDNYQDFSVGTYKYNIRNEEMADGEVGSPKGTLNLSVVTWQDLEENFKYSEALKQIGRSGSDALSIDWLGMPPSVSTKYMFSVINMIEGLIEKHGLPIIFEAKEDTSFRFLQSGIVQRYIAAKGYQISKPVFNGSLLHVMAIG